MTPSRLVSLLFALLCSLSQPLLADTRVAPPRIEIESSGAIVVRLLREVAQIPSARHSIEMYRSEGGEWTRVKRVDLRKQVLRYKIPPQTLEAGHYRFRTLSRGTKLRGKAKDSRIISRFTRSVVIEDLAGPGDELPPTVSPTPPPTELVTPPSEDPQQPEAPDEKKEENQLTPPTPTSGAAPTATPTLPAATPTPIPVVTSSYLMGGDGFPETIEAPAPIGNPGDVGYEALAIARWSSVPFQVVNNELPIGVVAFHRNGIAKVLFSANGGPWVAVDHPTVNPSNEVSEYWVTLRASDFPDSKVEVRALAIPRNAGIPRLLAGNYQAPLPNAQPNLGAAPATNGVYSLFIWTNAGGSYSRTPAYVSGLGSDSSGDGTLQNPFRTLKAAAAQLTAQYGTLDGSTIYCLPGEYPYALASSKADERFLTIAAAPGVPETAVLLRGVDGEAQYQPHDSVFLARIKLQNVSLVTNANGLFSIGSNSLRPLIWLSGAHVSAQNGRYGPTGGANVFMKTLLYVTDTEWTDTADGPVDSILIANTTVSKIKSDFFSGSQVVLSVQATDVDAADTGAHPDLYQIYRPNAGMDNHILYGMYAHDVESQGIFIAALAAGEKINNSAFVNVLIRKVPSNFTSQINTDCNHVLFINNTFDQTLFFRADGYTNVVFEGNLLSAVTVDLNSGNPDKPTLADIATINWNHNHFVDVTSYGTYSFGEDISTGPPQVVNWASGDYQPLAVSPLKGRVPTLHALKDVLGGSRATPATAIGAIEALE
jgi:hypothetical protein